MRAKSVLRRALLELELRIKIQPNMELFQKRNSLNYYLHRLQRIIVRILRDLFHIFRAPATQMNIRRSKAISIKTTDLCSVLSIGSIRTSRTLIFRKYRNKKVAAELPIN